MILGIDPWIRKLWYALIQKDKSIVDAGVITLDSEIKSKFSRENQYQRMNDIIGFFSELIKKHPIQRICIEKYFITNFNKKNAEFVYGTRALLLVHALQNNIPFDEYAPLEIKKYITGNWKANKETVQRFIQKIFQLKDIPEFDDTADALWLAYLWIRK